MEAGYLPTGLVNFLANIGWTFGDDREKFSIDEALERFELANISPTPASLPYSKLDWLNNQYIQELSNEELVKQLYPFMMKHEVEISADALLILAPVIKMRLKKLSDAFDQLAFLTAEAPLPTLVKEVTHKKMGPTAAAQGYDKTIAFLDALDPTSFNVEKISDGLRQIGEEVSEGGKPGPFLGTLRFVVTGQQVSQPQFESFVALGQERVIKRLQAARALLN
jgi:glutamyl-tRNA synthetase